MSAPFSRLIFAPVDIRAHVGAVMERFGVDEHQAWAALQAKLSADAFCDGKWIVTRREIEGGVTHLAMHRRDGSIDHDWRELQRIKSALAGAERWAAELYPPESQVIDLAPQYHLWVLRNGQRFPFGFAEGRRVVDDPRGNPVAVALRAKGK